MHYSKAPFLTALFAHVTTLTYASTNDQWVRHACPLVSSSKPKSCQFSYVALYAPLFSDCVASRIQLLYSSTVLQLGQY